MHVHTPIDKHAPYTHINTHKSGLCRRLWGFLGFSEASSPQNLFLFLVAGEANKSLLVVCVFVWVPLSWIPAPLWLRVGDNPPSSQALAHLQVWCLMQKQWQIPSFISSRLRDICCIIFDMLGADHQSTLLSLLLPLQQQGLFSALNEVRSVNDGCVQTWLCPQ